MAETFSTYEAKSRFSEIIRRVRAGRRVTVSYRGKPVAEIGPVTTAGSLDDRLKSLTDQGVVSAPADTSPRAALPAPTREPRPGALRRFLASRD